MSGSEHSSAQQLPINTQGQSTQDDKKQKREKKPFWKRHLWLLPLAGFFSLIWFLVRVIPKPSRASYPCQRAAFPLASSFVLWLTGSLGISILFKELSKHHKKVFTGLLVGGLLLGGCLATTTPYVAPATQDLAVEEELYLVSQEPNSPVGEARGIHPGRVVWAHDPEATSWNGKDGDYWDNTSTDLERVKSMMKGSLKALVQGEDPWHQLFVDFNTGYRGESRGYEPGETVLIKINENNQNNPYAEENKTIDALPATVYALIHELVESAGVPQEQIIVMDALRPISDPVLALCQPDFPQVQYLGGIGYPNNIEDTSFDWVPALEYSTSYIYNEKAKMVPVPLIEAEYLINMALLKSHGSVAGVTLTGKNWYGVIGAPEALHSITPAHRHGMDSYSPQVDLMGHEQIGEKTMLYIIDGIYATSRRDGAVGYPGMWKAELFGAEGKDWTNSLFMSQDGVAIDSVGYDFLKAEIRSLRPNGDRFLHEAALAHDPDSGVRYDPEGDGTYLSSLGVHEHWNNPVDKQYSLNLDPTAAGIELIFWKGESHDRN